MVKRLNWYDYFNILSLDVVSGAIISNIFVAHVLGIDLSFACVTILGLVVWLIYTTDHLLDGQKIPYPAFAPRHYFHQKYLKVLIWVSIGVLLIILGILPYLPPPVLIRGALLFFVISVYFLILHKFKIKFFPKELFIALVYASGIFLAPFVLHPHPALWETFLLYGQFLLLALNNLLLIGLFEQEIDKLEKQYSSLHYLTGKKAKILIGTVFVLILFFNFLFFSNSLNSGSHEFVPLIMILMVVPLLGIYFNPSFFRKNEWYRKWSDSIFIFPLFWLLW